MAIRMNLWSERRGVVAPPVALLVACMLVASLAGAPAVLADSGETAGELIVEPSPDGSVETSLVLPYDLRDDDDADGFTSLAEDEAAQDELRDRFETRMQTVAAATDELVDRDVSVSDATIELETDEAAATGTVTLSITWAQLAVLEDGSLVLTEPFASGFQSDHRVIVIAPDGYQFQSVAPSPTESGDRAAQWAGGTDLDGFEVVMDPVDAETDDATVDDSENHESLPGFGLLLGMGSILVAIAGYRFRCR